MKKELLTAAFVAGCSEDPCKSFDLDNAPFSVRMKPTFADGTYSGLAGEINQALLDVVKGGTLPKCAADYENPEGQTVHADYEPTIDGDSLSVNMNLVDSANFSTSEGYWLNADCTVRGQPVDWTIDSDVYGSVRFEKVDDALELQEPTGNVETDASGKLVCETGPAQ